jgi:hypothetical protein
MFLASPLLVLPVWDYRVHAEAVEGFVPAKGVVVDHVKVSFHMHFPEYKSIIEYRGVAGARFRVVDQVSRRPAEAIGTQVALLVSPSHPESAVRAGMFGHWFRFSLTLLFSTLTSLMATAFTVSANRSARARLERIRARVET